MAFAHQNIALTAQRAADRCGFPNAGWGGAQSPQEGRPHPQGTAVIAQVVRAAAAKEKVPVPAPPLGEDLGHIDSTGGGNQPPGLVGDAAAGFHLLDPFRDDIQKGGIVLGGLPLKIGHADSRAEFDFLQRCPQMLTAGNPLPQTGQIPADLANVPPLRSRVVLESLDAPVSAKCRQASF